MELSEILSLQQHDQAVPQYLLKNYEDAFQDYRDALDNFNQKIEISFRSKMNSFNSEQGYKGKIYVLIDDGYGSSCEEVLLGLKSHPNTIVIGKNSSGTKHFENMGILLLSNSKIIVQIGTHFWKFKNDLFIEKREITSEIIVPAGENALDVVSSIIN